MKTAPPRAPAPTGVYVHFPFCAARCTYCDFPTEAGRDQEVNAYLEMLAREIAEFQPEVPRNADTVYLGGGTPSRMTPIELRHVLDAVAGRFRLEPGAEISLEANPESVDARKLAAYRHAGVNRLTIGVQSLDDGVLRSVGRLHGAAEALRAVETAHRAGIPQVGMDLIAGLPGEDPDGWAETVRRTVALEPEHVSVYMLESDKETPLAAAVRAGRVRLPPEDRVAEMYRDTVEVLAGAGYRQYEISNFCRPGCASRHNRKYWTDAPYAGFGTGAHGYAAGARRANHRDLDRYVADLASGRDPVAETDPWDPVRRRSEALILGLRLVEGVDLTALERRYGGDLRREYRKAWERAGEAGLVEWEGNRVRLTGRGRLHSNELFADLV